MTIRSPPSSPSETSLLAFSYENVYNEIDYPNDYHNTRSPSLEQTPRPNNSTPKTRNGFTPLVSQQELSSKRIEEGSEGEFLISSTRKTLVRNRMDPFSRTEIAVMVLSSALVVILIVIAVMMTVGELTL